VRIDKWLWVARFYKSRVLAVAAVNGGRVHLNGQRVKSSREVRPGDRLDLTLGLTRMIIVVRALAERRGPAAEAALLYEETPESRAERELRAEQRRLSAPRQSPGGPRPTKRDRRRDAAGPTGKRRRTS